MHYRTIDSPIGPLLVAGDDDGLRFLLFGKGRNGQMKPKPEWEPDRGTLKEPAKQLTAYFAGKLREFDLPWRQRERRSSVPSGANWQNPVRRDHQLRRVGAPAG